MADKQVVGNVAEGSVGLAIPPIPGEYSQGRAIVRKCAGKNKQAECLQQAEHQNSRWECNFESADKEEFLRHCKNILKRTKWRDMVNSMKSEKDGMFHCVYFSTDRHHVENHYQKASMEGASQMSPDKLKGSKRWYNYQERKDYDEEEVDEESEGGSKRLRNDQGLFVSMVSDNQKCEEIIDGIQKKLELPAEMCQTAVEILHKQGYVIAAGLKTLKKDGWARLGLPLAIEEELKAQVMAKVAYYPPQTTNTFPYNVVPLYTNNATAFYYQQLGGGPLYYTGAVYDQDGQAKTEEQTVAVEGHISEVQHVSTESQPVHADAQVIHSDAHLHAVEHPHEKIDAVAEAAHHAQILEATVHQPDVSLKPEEIQVTSKAD